MKKGTGGDRREGNKINSVSARFQLHLMMPEIDCGCTI